MQSYIYGAYLAAIMFADMIIIVEHFMHVITAHEAEYECISGSDSHLHNYVYLPRIILYKLRNSVYICNSVLL